MTMIGGKVKKSTDAATITAGYRQNPVELDGVADMSSLVYLEEENVVHNLMHRFKAKTIYTNIAKILVAVNPYERIKMYGPDFVEKYESDSRAHLSDPDITPHCYQVSARAYVNMKKMKTSQSLIVCGESGAGKTESAKALMQYIAKTKAPHNSEKNIDARVLAVNPILESFGNAKTVLNNNSSRFGKFTKMLFSPFTNNASSGKIAGTMLESYLLEKSRVVQQDVGERNFHVFFQAFNGLKHDTSLKLENLSDFYYLAQRPENEDSHTIDGVSDEDNFGEIKAAMSKLEISEDVQDQIFRLVIGILHLGNIAFLPGADGNSRIDRAKTKHHLKLVAELFGCGVEDVISLLTTRNIKVVSEVITTPFSPTEALYNRDSIAKSIYNGIFDWLIDRMNEVLLQSVDTNPNDMQFIGVLDVFGFECFQHNSFEQFCINFANERLQQLFSESLIASEQREYLAEGVYWMPLQIPNNDDYLHLVDSKPNGVFSLLDSACNMPKGTDDIFIRNIFAAHPKHAKLSKVKLTREFLATQEHNEEQFQGFQIHHYAANVIYNGNKFLSKNKDLVSSDTTELLSQSSVSVLQDIFPPSTDGDVIDSSVEPSKRKRANMSKQNIGTVFSKQLNNLIVSLQKTEQHYIRCINPNTKKSSELYDRGHVAKQLRCAGLVQALKVMKLGYPTRISFEALESQHRSRIQSHKILDNLDRNTFWNAILVAFGFDNSKYQFGFSKIFFKSNVPFLQELQKHETITLTENQVKTIKRFLIQKRMKKLRGVLKSQIRISKQLQKIRLHEIFKIPLVIHFTVGRALLRVRKKMKQEEEERERSRQLKELEKLEKKDRADRIANMRRQQSSSRQAKMIELEKEKEELEKKKKEAEEDHRTKLRELKKMQVEQQQHYRQQLEEVEKLRIQKMEEAQDLITQQIKEHEQQLEQERERARQRIEQELAEQLNAQQEEMAHRKSVMEQEELQQKENREIEQLEYKKKITAAQQEDQHERETVKRKLERDIQQLKLKQEQERDGHKMKTALEKKLHGELLASQQKELRDVRDQIGREKGCLTEVQEEHSRMMNERRIKTEQFETESLQRIEERRTEIDAFEMESMERLKQHRAKAEVRQRKMTELIAQQNGELSRASIELDEMRDRVEKQKHDTYEKIRAREQESVQKLAKIEERHHEMKEDVDQYQLDREECRVEKEQQERMQIHLKEKEKLIDKRERDLQEREERLLQQKKQFRAEHSSMERHMHEAFERLSTKEKRLKDLEHEQILNINEVYSPNNNRNHNHSTHGQETQMHKQRKAELALRERIESLRAEAQKLAKKKAERKKAASKWEQEFEQQKREVNRLSQASKTQEK